MHAQPTDDRARGRRRVVAAAVAVLVLVGILVAVVVTRSDPTPVAPGAPIPRGAGAGQQLASSTATGGGPTGTSAGPTGPAGTPGTPVTTRSPAPDCGAWGCPQQARFAAAAALVRARPGQLGSTVLDRRTGAVWRAGSAGHVMWASSTPKLALAASLLEQARAGRLTLDATARARIDAMLAVSDDDAADALWDRYGGDSLVPRFRDAYGMTGLTFVPGFPRRWGFLKCSTADLVHLMTYVLTRLAGPDRDHLLAAMRSTGPVQHWGVWAAGRAQQPGAKDGWSVESDPGGRHWCTSSVGFAGPGARYVVAVMHDLPPGAGIGTGVHAVSDLVATVFGAPVPAAVTVPDESTGR